MAAVTVRRRRWPWLLLVILAALEGCLLGWSFLSAEVHGTTHEGRSWDRDD